MYIVALILFIDFLSFGLILPLTPLFQEIYKLSSFDVGLFTAIFFISSLIGGLILGPLSDKVGRKPILLISTLGLTISYLVNSLIQMDNYLNTFTNMMILRYIIGFFSGNIPVVFACSVDISSNNLESRRKVMAILGAVIGLGFMLGPTIGGILSEFTQTKCIAPFYFSAVMCLICFLLVLILFKETLPKFVHKKTINQNNSIPNIINPTNKSNKLIALLSNSKVLIYLFLFVGFFFSFTGFEVYLITIVLSEQLKLSQLYVGLFWTLFAFCNSIFQFVLLKVAKLRLALILGFFIYAIGMLSYTITNTSIWLVIISMVICAIGIGFILPNISALVSLEGPEDEQGLIFSINQSFGAVGRFLGPFILGWILNIFNTVNAIWIFMFVLMLIQGFIVIYCVPKEFKK